MKPLNNYTSLDKEWWFSQIEKYKNKSCKDIHLIGFTNNKWFDDKALILHHEDS